jgi:hypothetical protein
MPCRAVPCCAVCRDQDKAKKQPKEPDPHLLTHHSVVDICADDPASCHAVLGHAVPCCAVCSDKAKEGPKEPMPRAQKA